MTVVPPDAARVGIGIPHGGVQVAIAVQIAQFDAITGSISKLLPGILKEKPLRRRDRFVDILIEPDAVWLTLKVRHKRIQLAVAVQITEGRTAA